MGKVRNKLQVREYYRSYCRKFDILSVYSKEKDHGLNARMPAIKHAIKLSGLHYGVTIKAR